MTRTVELQGLKYRFITMDLRAKISLAGFLSGGGGGEHLPPLEFGLPPLEFGLPP